MAGAPVRSASWTAEVATEAPRALAARPLPPVYPVLTAGTPTAPAPPGPPALALPSAAPLGSLLCQSIGATAEELTLPGFRTAVETGTENPLNMSKDDPKFREIGNCPDSIVDVGVG